MKVLVLFYSIYGHVHRLAQAAAEGGRALPGPTRGADPEEDELRRTP
jgi:hypothetical protein